MSSRIAGIALAGVCVGAIACDSGRQAVKDGGSMTPIAGCPNLSGYATCAAREVTGPFVPRRASVLLVVERSGRLLRVPPGATDDTWAAMTMGLAAALDRPWGNVEFAMLGYPSGTSTGCGEGCCTLLPASSAVRGPFGPDSAARIVEALLSDQPEGEAPMAAALATARQYLTEVDVPAEGDAFVVLVAGGGPDCNDASVCGAERCVPNLEGRCASGANCCADAAGAVSRRSGRDRADPRARGRGDRDGGGRLAGGGRFRGRVRRLRAGGGRPNPATGGAYYTGASAAEIEATMTAIFGGLGARCEAALSSPLPSVPPYRGGGP